MNGESFPSNTLENRLCISRRIVFCVEGGRRREVIFVLIQLSGSANSLSPLENVFCFGSCLILYFLGRDFWIPC